MAAGKGQRISEITDSSPKSYLELCGKRILDHQLDALGSIGVSEVIMVVGYRHKLIERDYAGQGITFVRNPFYECTNVLGSVWFAREHLRNGFFFMHADTFFEPSILEDLRLERGESVLCVDKKEESVPEEMKVKVSDGKIYEINKGMDCAAAFGEFIGLAKFDRSVTARLLWHIDNRIENLGRRNDFFEAVIQDLIDEGKTVSSFDIGNRVAIEIDFPDDYQRAKKLVESLMVC